MLFGAVQLAAFLALEHEEVYLDVVVGQSLLRSHADEARIERQRRDDGCGDEGVLLGVGDAQKAELQRVVVVEAEHQQDVDGEEPSVASHTVEDASQAALLASQTSQLSVGAVKDIRPAEQQDADDVEPKALPALVVVAAMHEKDAAGGTDKHRGDGDGIGMNIELGKEHGQEITQRAHHAIVEPVFCFRRL